MDAGASTSRCEPSGDTLLIPAWYAVHTRSRHEQVVHDQLTAKGTEVFLPKMEVWSRRTDRRKRITIPMFPGYLFVRTTLHPEHHLGVLKTVGVVGMVSFHGRPAAVNPEEVSSLKIVVDTGAVIHPTEDFRKGDLVRITDGPFKGVIGRLTGRRSNRKLIVAVENINQAISVEIDDHMVVKAEVY